MSAAFSTYRTMLIHAIKESMPELKEVSGHAGRFDAEELKRVGVSAPAVRIALLGAPGLEETSDERIRATLMMAVFVITRDAPGLPRDEAAINITEGLIRLISLNQWGIRTDAGFGILLPQDMRAENIWSSGAARNGVALWAVSWRQTLILGESIFRPDGVMPWQLYISENGGGPELLFEARAGGGDG